MSLKQKTLVAAMALAGSLAALPGTASAYLNNWYFCTGGGCNSSNYSTNGILIYEYLDLVGPSYVQTSTLSGSGSFTFNEWGAFNVAAHDGGSAFPVPPGSPNYITALFQGSGVGHVGGALSYGPTGGITIYSDSVNNFGTSAGIYGANDGVANNPIGNFAMVSGYGAFTSPGGVSNGFVTLIAAATSLDPGYFFDNAGNDLSALVASSPTPVLFGFTTVNFSVVGNPATIVVQEIVNQFAGDPTFSNTVPTPTTPGELIIANNGQFRVVPEPASLALLGLGFSAMGFMARRRKQAFKQG